MKKIFISIIFVIIIVFISPFSIASSKAIVNIEAVRMRKEKSTESEILTIVYENDECELLDDDGQWCKIKYGEYTGYAKSEFFTIKKDNSSNTTNTQNNTNTNIAKNTNNTVNTTNNINNTITNKVENTINETTNSVNNNITNNSTDDTQNVENNIIEIEVSKTYNIINNINIKNLPNFASVNKCEILAGTTIKVEKNKNNWYKISQNDKSGWINKKDLNNALNNKTTQEESTNGEQTVENEIGNTTIENKVTNSTTENKNTIKNETSNTVTNTTTNTATTTTNTKTGVVNVDTARVREKASTTAEIIGTLDRDEVINIIGEEGDFYKFKTSNIEGYVSKTLIDIKNVTSRSTTETRANVVENNIVSEENVATEEVNNALNNTEISSGTGADVVEFAKKYLGYSYVSGGKTPETGFDCSGFTKYVFSNFGITLGATTSDQITQGTEVARENMQIGDIILFYNDANTKVGHVGIYMGNDEFIHSANPKRGVVTDNINTNTYYNTRFICARRLL